MKREDLEKLGLTKEQIDSVCDLNNKDMKPVKDDLKKAQDDLKVAQEKLTTAEEAVKKFDGVDLEKQNQQIKDLQDALKKKEEEHAAELAARDFNSLLEKSISSVKGKNSKAIMALLDMDSLRSSKNQKEDVEKALKALAEAEDSKMLFGEPETKPTGTQSIIGAVTKSTETAKETLGDALAAHYKN